VSIWRFLGVEFIDLRIIGAAGAIAQQDALALAPVDIYNLANTPTAIDVVEPGVEHGTDSYSAIAFLSAACGSN